MVEPEIAENTVPATTATTERRPGTRQISRSMASMAFMATPVWKSTSPISTKNGIGVREKLAMEATPLRIICTSPASPPSHTHGAHHVDAEEGEGRRQAHRGHRRRPK